MTFDSFIGNRRTVDRIQQKLRQDRFPHALIFSGPEGVGKHTCALMVAQALNCERSSPSVLFCDECRGCRKIDSGIHPDVMAVAVEEEATEIKIAQVRRILSTLAFEPLEGRNKIFIIDRAGLMTTEASNALLKGLEEPPAHTFFILITAGLHELLPTIRSRCQIYHFSPLTVAELRSHGVQDELLARWVQGSIGLARRLDMQALKKDRETALEFLETAVTAAPEDFRNMLGACADLARSKQDFPGYLAIVSVLLSDLMRISEGIPEKIVNIDIGEPLRRLAAHADTERWLNMGDVVMLIEISLKNHVNRQMLTEALALAGNETTSKILNDNPWKSR
jgi:DNA polymerase-3 subunit delta'